MSGAIRSKRSTTLRNIGSPYAGGRPVSKKSSWSTSSLLSFFNPLNYLRSSSTSNVEDSDDDLSDSSAESAAKALSARGQEISASIRSRNDLVQQQQYQPPPPPPNASNLPPPPKSSTFHPPPSSSQSPTTSREKGNDSSTVKNGLDAVAQFLESHGGQELSRQDAQNLINIIKSEQRETFRFSSSTPSTPNRGNSPLPSSNGSFQFSLPSTSTTIDITSPATSKSLKVNPNGRYRYEGGGSAKPARSRNRFQSPAFGSSRGTPERIVLRDSPEKEPIKTDTKRRRVGEISSSTASPSGLNGSAGSSSLQASQSLPFPVSNVNGSPSKASSSNEVTSKVNGTSHPVTPRLRTSMIHTKPTTPAIPSPLRQTWGQSGSPPSRSESEESQPPRQTRAANFMTELIKEVTPVKRLEVSNPYQAARPVPASGPSKPRPKRVRAAKPAPKEVNGVKPSDVKDAEKEKEREKEYSAQAIIEATIPKGSKRSRPPAQSEGMNGTSSVQKLLLPPQVEEVEDEEDARRHSKRAKPNGLVNGSAKVPPTTSGPTITEVVDEDEIMADKTAAAPSQIIEPKEQPSSSAAPTSSSLFGVPAPTTAGSSRSLFSNTKATSAPKEPSKLRFSYQPDVTPSPSTSASSTPAPSLFPPAKPSTPAPSLAAPLFPSAVASASASASTSSKKDPKKFAASIPVLELPVYSFPTPPLASGSGSEVSSSVTVKARGAAKTAPVSSLPKFDFSKPTLAAPKAVPAPAPAVKAFDWGAAGMKPPTSSSGGTWTCNSCMLQNDNSAADKCKICEAPREDKKSAAAPVKAFDWSAAGMKAPGASSGGSWECGSCMLQNDDAAADKCKICEAPREDKKAAAPAPKAFDWSAAGLMKPQGASLGLDMLDVWVEEFGDDD
ncbi:hypothetical protein D9758_006068 [Tetrapyrgos nigripes]|uniref:RanBP2-type domain-containing protein n=1 Tax=Tetrapyrgos nigripes TaxID=182062 RepID=A0A8H5DAI1_9AGAR|nr:hypothetical protein D9758_006068 [Tetrapyrgos nigripes]